MAEIFLQIASLLNCRLDICFFNTFMYFWEIMKIVNNKKELEESYKSQGNRSCSRRKKV